MLADFGTVGIAITIVAMLLTRAVNKTGELLMSLYQFVVNRYVIPVIEGHKAEGPGRRTRGGPGGGPRAGVWPKFGPSCKPWNERRHRRRGGEGREFAEPTPQG